MKRHILVLGAGFGGVWSCIERRTVAGPACLHGCADHCHWRRRRNCAFVRSFYEPNVHEMKAPLAELFDATGIQVCRRHGRQHRYASGKRVEYIAAPGVHSVG
jgi:NADH dehydrogenase